MKKALILFICILVYANSLKSQVERYDSLYTVASDQNFNFRNPVFEERDMQYGFTDYLTLTYEKRDTLNSISNIVFRKAIFKSFGPEVMITNDNFLNTNATSTHTFIAWQTNRNSNLDIYYSVYSNSAWSSPAPLSLAPAYETSPSAAEIIINNNTAYFIVHESMGEIFLKILYQGVLLKDTNLTANISEACSGPEIRGRNSFGRFYISYLKVVNSVKRIMIYPATVNTNFSVNFEPGREVIQNNSADNIGFSNGGNFLQGFLTYNYDTLVSAHSMGIELMGFSKTIFTDQFAGRNYNGSGSLFPIITDNTNNMQGFTTFGWNMKRSDSSFIMAGIQYFPPVTKRFYIGDSSVIVKPDVSDFILINYYTFFRIAWEQKINGRYAIMESRYADFLSGISEGITENINYKLGQNYPNPFNPNTVIGYELKTFSFVSLKVYDINGREVETLVNESKNPGSYIINWNAENHPSGVYYYKLTAENFSETKKMVLLR